MKIWKINIIVILMAITFVIPSQSVDEIFGNSPVLYFSFDYKNKRELDNLSNIISIDHKTNPYKAYAYANRKEFKDFLKEDIDYQIVEERINFDNSSNNRSNWDFYPT